jgi:UDP-N-acetyl-D-glucosamine dehydrogenase
MSVTSPQHIVIVGQGYVGLPLSVATFAAGNRVTGIDLDLRKIELLVSGISPVEDIPSDVLKPALANKSYKASNNYADAKDFDFAILTVPTPLAAGQPDLSFIESAGESIAVHLRAGATVILESTTYPGTTEELLVPLLEKGSGLVAGEDFFVGYSPERIDPGNPTWNLLNTPKIVSGINDESLERVQGFYQSLGIPTVTVKGTREAEMSKLLENTFRHVNIALVNELARFSRFLGVNLWEAIEAANTKPFGFMKFTPGPGVGGHCLPIDPSYLSWAIKDKTGSDFKFVSLANSVNNSMPEFVLERAREVLTQKGMKLQGAKTVILGLAYKPNTGDTRESPALALAELLSLEGAEVYGVDTHVPMALWPAGISRVEPDSDSRFDLAILVTNHTNIKLPWILSQSKSVLDTRNCLQGTNVEQL